jgi:Zn-dependent M28 family amino/carboxypeptidase
MRTVVVLVCLALTVVALGCQGPPEEARPETINAESLMDRITFLSSDELQGRAPGSAGEEKTVDYLTKSFRSFGLAPGNQDGSYIQKVPLVSLTPEELNPVVLRRGTEVRELEPIRDVAAKTRRVVDEVAIEADLVFVGYGVVAPEYDWDDYKGIDLSGKALLMLVNDPPVEGIFGDKAMTYYGRWTYKYEIAAELGAAAAFVIHETEPAGYPWGVISDAGAEEFVLASSNQSTNLLAVQGWLHVDATRKIFEMAGKDFDELKEAASTRSFEPVALEVTASVVLKNSIRNLESANALAKLEGKDSPDELIIYTAHWDHLGIDPELSGDNIFNGAHDNASGTAGLLEIAEAFGRLDEPPARSVLFLAVTAEEKGLLGSKYYAQNPLYPPEKTVAVINMDGLNSLGPTRDVTVVGMGQSAFYPDEGIEYINKPEGWGIEMRDKYTREDYHKPSDEVKDYWDLSGAVEDLELFYRMGYELATSSDWPVWSETSEFRAKREASPQ